MIDANENRSEGELNMKNLNDNSSAKRKRTFENFVHGIFLILGLVTVACVLLISIYLIVSGIPAIRQIGLINFLFGKKWEPTAATPAFGILPFILTSIYGTGRRNHTRRADRLSCLCLSCKSCKTQTPRRCGVRCQSACRYSVGCVRPCGYVCSALFRAFAMRSTLQTVPASWPQ